MIYVGTCTLSTRVQSIRKRQKTTEINNWIKKRQFTTHSPATIAIWLIPYSNSFHNFGPESNSNHNTKTYDVPKTNCISILILILEQNVSKAKVVRARLYHQMNLSRAKKYIFLRSTWLSCAWNLHVIYQYHWQCTCTSTGTCFYSYACCMYICHQCLRINCTSACKLNFFFHQIFNDQLWSKRFFSLPSFHVQYVTAFVVSASASNVDRFGKPFNPLLGETYELSR